MSNYDPNNPYNPGPPKFTNPTYHITDGKDNRDMTNHYTGADVTPIDVSNLILAVIDVAEQVVSKNGYDLHIERVAVVCLDILSSSRPESPFNRTIMDSLQAGLAYKGYSPTQQDIDKVHQDLSEGMGIPPEFVDAAVSALKEQIVNSGKGGTAMNPEDVVRFVDQIKHGKDVESGKDGEPDGRSE
jgi:hypothetical protein